MSEDLDTLLARLEGDMPPASNGLMEIEDILPASVEVNGSAPPLLDVRKHIKRHEAISDEILSSWRSDREEAQSAINTIRDIIDDATQKGQVPSGTVLEAYVGAIKAKIDTNAVAAKLLDAGSRLIQTTKPTVNIKQTNTNNYNDLTAILNNPVGADDV